MQSNFELKSLSIEYQIWGEYKGKYVGKVKFENGNQDAFMFTLSTEETMEYINIISKKVGASAQQLGETIASSMQAIQVANNKTIQIEAPVE